MQITQKYCALLDISYWDIKRHKVDCKVNALKIVNKMDIAVQEGVRRARADLTSGDSKGKKIKPRHEKNYFVCAKKKIIK